MSIMRLIVALLRAPRDNIPLVVLLIVTLVLRVNINLSLVNRDVVSTEISALRVRTFMEIRILSFAIITVGATEVQAPMIFVKAAMSQTG